MFLILYYIQSKLDTNIKSISETTSHSRQIGVYSYISRKHVLKMYHKPVTLYTKENKNHILI